MAGATLTTLSNILKEFYLPPVVDQLNSEVLLLQRLESRDQELFGNQAVVPLHSNRSGGIGAAAEDGDLPTAGNQEYNKAVFNLKYLYGRVRVTGPAMAKTASEAGAFLQALKSELDGIRTDLRKDVARQVYGTGDGKIVAITGDDTAGVIPIASREPIDKGQLYIGMLVTTGTVADIDAGSGTSSPLTISDVTAATPTITTNDLENASASTHFVFRYGSVANNVCNEIDSGLQKLVSTAANSVGGIDASAAGKGFWDNLRTNVNGALALNTMMQSFNRVRIAGGNLSAIYTSFGIQRAYFNLLQSQVRYVNPTTIKGGFSVLDFNGQPLIADLEAPWGKMFWLDESYIKVFSNRDWHFLDEDGDVLKWVTGKDAYEAALARYMNLGITRRNVQLVAYGITDTVGY